MLNELRVRMTGVSPLIVHSARGVNALDPLVKERNKLTGTRGKKTDANTEELARIEWFLSIIVDDKDRPVIPGEYIEANLRSGAMKFKKGKQFQSSVFCNDATPIIYDGPKTATKLWDDRRFVDIRPMVVQRSKVMRCRPIFQAWSLEPVVTYDDAIVDLAEVERAFQVAGRECGFCDSRPRYGRYIVEMIS